MVIEGKEYIRFRQVMELLDMGDLADTSFFQKHNQEKVKKVRKITMGGADYFKKSDVLRIMKQDEKEEKLMINTQRLIMNIQDATGMFDIDLSLLLGFGTKHYMAQCFMLNRTRTNKHSARTWKMCKRYFPKIYDDYMENDYV